MAVLIFLGCLLGGIAIGLPISWALLLCGAALMFWLDMFDVQIMAQTLVNGADSFSLLAIPFFVLAGEIMNAGGLSKRIVDLPMKLVGHKPGGLGYVGVLAAMIMASLSGSAVADTAAVAALLVPMMRSANYPVNRAAGLIASGGIIAPIIPPSIPFIIFGVTARNISIRSAGAMKPRREGLLPVIGIGPMLTQVVLIQQFVLHRRELRRKLARE
jgi:TRAP-type transport system large permease protein